MEQHELLPSILIPSFLFDKLYPLVYHTRRRAMYNRAAQWAEVAELADALRSGRSEGNLVRVQISPSAPLQ